MLKIASWNVNSIKVRLEQLLLWLQDNPMDILAIQETKTVDEQFPQEAILQAGYDVVFSGQKTYNGVALLSKGKAQDVVTDWPGFEDPQRRILAATIGDVRVINVYVPNGASIDSDKYEYKLAWLKSARDYINDQLSQYPDLVVLGDFNIAPEDRDVHDPKAWEGKVHVSGPERQAQKALLDLGLTDTFRIFDQEDKSYSWWDYRMGGFRRNHGLRIDHILASSSLAERCQSASIDKNPRKWERPSDHAPVLATFA